MTYILLHLAPQVQVFHTLHEDRIHRYERILSVIPTVVFESLDRDKFFAMTLTLDLGLHHQYQVNTELTQITLSDWVVEYMTGTKCTKTKN